MPPPPQSKPLSIDDLPTEVLALVLNHVHVKHLPKLALTNAAWGQPNVFELLWSMVCTAAGAWFSTCIAVRSTGL